MSIEALALLRGDEPGFGFREPDGVVLVVDAGGTIPAGTEGTVAAVWGGEAFEIAFAEPEG